MNKQLNSIVNAQIRHSQALSQFQRAQRTALAQIRRVGFETTNPVKIDEWLSAIDSAIESLNLIAIELDKHFEEGAQS